MRYTMTRPHKLQERFEIANEADEIEFEARVHSFGSVSLLDRTGREVASSHVLFDGGADIRIEGKDVAKIFFVRQAHGYSIPSAFGEFEATVQALGWGDRWTLTRDGVPVATREDQILKNDPVRGTNKHQVEITDGENTAFVLVTLFAVKNVTAR
jgi:hypothetical protein